jgi:predicted ATPase/DNA-binding SARP family transcriptional activator
MLKALEVTLTGGFELKDGSGTYVRFRTRNAASLFAFLCTHQGRSWQRSEICQMFWPDKEPESAKHNLRQTLSTLRSILEPAGVEPGSVLIADRTTVKLEPRAISCDIHILGSALKEASPKAIEEAVQLIRGEFLPSFQDEWAEPIRALVSEQHALALKTLVDLYRDEGQRERALVHCRRLVDLNPLDEDSQSTLIRLLAESGRAEDALRQYRTFRKLLKLEFGDEPDPALTKFVLTLKGSHGSLATVVPTAEPMPRLPHLPPLLTRTFGRDEDIEQLERSVRDDKGPRLITLVGPGGAGKTRLSLELAHRLKAAHGLEVCFVELADLQDQRWFFDRVLESVGLRPSAHASNVEQLRARCQDRLILVLDNLEQLQPAVSSSVLHLLAEVPTLKLVATSRKPLGISGEMVWQVRPLAVSESVGASPGFPAVDMFLDRARQARSDFRLSERNAVEIGEICRKLEGSPLAIELAAARLKTRTAAELLTSLAERFKALARQKRGTHRHSSLWQAIDWSFSLLPASTQELFTSLSVFRGGWTQSAATVICGATEEGLETLRSHSLIYLDAQESELRYSMFESIREFAEEKLASATAQALIVSHAKYFRSLSWQLHEEQRGTQQHSANERFRLEQANMLIAIERGATGSIPIADALEIANRNYRFWEMRGQWRQARAIYEDLLEADDGTPTAERALALISLSNLLRMQGEAALAVALTEESLQIREGLGDHTGVSSALGHLAQLHHVLGNYELGVDLYERCLAIQKEIGADWSYTMNLLNLGWLFVTMNRMEDAEARLRSSLEGMLRLGDKWGVAAATGNLAEVAFRKKDYPASKQLHLRSLQIFEEINDLPAIAEELEALAALALVDQQVQKATQLFAAAGALRAEVASTPSPSQLERIEERCLECKNELSEEAFSDAWEKGAKLTWQDAIKFASAGC